MKRLPAGLFCVALLSASSVGRADELPPIAVDASAAGVDAARMREAVGRELTRSAVAPDDPRAHGEELTITADRNAKTLTVSFRSAGRVVTRTVPLPPTASAIESAAVILAGNLARDQAGEILAERRPSPRPPPTASPDLATMKAQVDAYERGAKAYRDTLTDIVRLHYEAKKHAVLSGLDRDLAIEKAQLDKARATAMKRLEDFLAAHAGEQGTEVPDAMARLAALEDERATEDSDHEREARLHEIRLYKRILREYPTYRGTAAAYYYLGHALADAGRVPEAQQVWRALVCHDRYAYPVEADPADAQRDVVHPVPSGSGSSYIDPFPADCRPVASSPPGPRYVAEVWWQIGNWEFDQLDGAAGPWGYDRAASAYSRALAIAQPPIYGVALYKYAWTLFKQQHYEAATKAFVDLLRHTDEEEQRTGARSADFREEAATYIAASLTSLAPKMLGTAIDRLTDPTIVPQDRAWTIDVYRAVALELRGLDAFPLAARVYEAMLQRWPLAPSAPATQNAIAETFDELASISKDAGAATDSALDARTKLVRYNGSTPWAQANAGRPDALREAERLARSGLRRAAAQHTNLARGALDAGDVVRAEAEYEHAATAWTAWLGQQSKPEDDGEPDVQVARYWNADARHKLVRLKVRRHEEPSAAEIEAATLAATVVRDSHEDDRYLDNAAYLLVDLADVRRDLAQATHRVERREEVPFDGADPRTRSVVRLEIPEPVAQSMRARDAYAELVPPERDVLKRAVGYRYWVAETQFLYGQWAEARPRFEAIWREQCGVDAYGFKAWEKLLTMATKARDATRAALLLDAVDPRKGGRSCDAAAESRHAEPIRLELALEKVAASLDYAGTADAEAKVASSAAFDTARRRDAAKTAVALYAALGERERARDVRHTLAALHPTARDLAEADWRTLSPDAFHRDYQGRPFAADLVLEAAYAAAREKRANGEVDVASWLSRTVTAWDDLRKREDVLAQRAPYVDHAAEAAFTLLDEEIAAQSDARGSTPPLRVARVFEQFAKGAADANRWDLRFEREVVRKYKSATWVAAALARQGALFDALRSGLYDTTSPILFDAAGERLLSGLRRAGQADRADALEDAARDAWRRRKQTELDGADEVMVRRYAAAVAVARAYGVTTPAVTRAAARLAYYTDIVGDAKLGSWVAKVPDPTDPSGLTKLTYRERMYDQSRPGIRP